MKRMNGSILTGCALLVATTSLATAQTPTARRPIVLPELSNETKECIKCHKNTEPGIFAQWGESLHYRANVGCYECHKANEGEPDAFDHFGKLIATIVSPKDCSQCHQHETAEFAASHH